MTEQEERCEKCMHFHGLKHNFTKEDLEKAIHEVDLIQHPYILLVNPSEEDRLKEALKGTELEDKVIVQPCFVAEVGKAIFMDRKKLEDWGTPEVKFDFGADTLGEQ